MLRYNTHNKMYIYVRWIWLYMFLVYVEITATKGEKFCKGGASRRNIFNMKEKKKHTNNNNYIEVYYIETILYAQCCQIFYIAAILTACIITVMST